MPKKLTHEKAVEKAWSTHPQNKNDYGYLKEYPGGSKKWMIYCYRCKNWFLQRAMNHINGQGCRRCSYDKRREHFASNLLTFTKKSNKIHQNIYDYSKGRYCNSMTKIEIVCPKHGSFWQRPNDHFNKHGCPKCAKENYKKSRIPLEEVLEEARVIHGGLYDYSLIDHDSYTSKGSNKVSIFCKIHGIFKQSLETHCGGAGCPDCANHGFNLNRPAILYYVKDIPSGLYKIGITNNSLKIRFAGKFSRINIIKTWNYKIGKNAKEHEVKLHKQYNKFRLLNESWITGQGSDGATEFFDHDILNLDKREKICLQ